MQNNKTTNSDKEELLELKGFLTFLLLHELNREKLCGDELSKKIGLRKGSNLTPGTIYPTLKRLRKLKLLTYKRYGRKKVYSLTNLGAQEIEKLYCLFGNYFYGLRDRISRKPVDFKAKKDKEKDLKVIKTA